MPDAASPFHRSALACPKCLKTECLWEEVMVPGWQSCDAFVDETGRRRTEGNRRGHPSREIDWTSGAVAEIDMGCSDCGWEGSRSELVQLGNDGKPLPAVHPGQERLIDAA